MNTRALPLVVIGAIISVFAQEASAACTPTGYYRDGINMTAVFINPAGPVTGDVDATGCNVAVYYDHAGTGGAIAGADIHGANYFGVLVNGDGGTVSVDILGSTIHDIGDVPHNGTQHGVAVYYRGFFPVSNVTGKISRNTITAYQKGGIVANGPGTQVMINDNTVTGDGHVTFIAQNGIQVGYGATASVMRNTVSGNSYIGFPGDGSASGGIIVVGGAGYNPCPDTSTDCPLTVNTRINDNILVNNDVGIYLSNWSGTGAPDDATNAKAVNNTISSDLCFNNSYQAGVSDVGNNDKIINNRISGAGYLSCATGFAVDADQSFTNRPKVHANK